jgi:oligosaccharide repeat unit polymerase
MEANWTAIVLIFAASACSAYLGRAWFQRYLNPLTLYSAMWGICLIAYELRLLQYYALSVQAWIYVLLAWTTFHMGVGTSVLFSAGAKNNSLKPTVDIRRLQRVILVLCAIGAISIISQVTVLTREFGSVLTAIVLQPGDVYLGRTNGEFSFFPYVAACLFTGCCLGGVHCAGRGRLSLTSLLPLSLAVINAMLGMARGGALIAGFLFVVSFVLTPKSSRIDVPVWQKSLGVLIVGSLLIGEFAFVSTTRHLQTDFPGRTDAIDRVTEYIPPFPSLYSNISAPPVAFSMYLDTPSEYQQGFWGMNTFAPIYRLLTKLGFQLEVPIYEENYYTPVPMNTSTYLKDLHSDFGPLGIAIFPYVLGLVTGKLGCRLADRPRVVDIVLLSQLMLIIAASFAINLMFTGDWPISTIAGIVAAYVVDRSSTRRTYARGEIGRSRPQYAAGPEIGPAL